MTRLHFGGSFNPIHHGHLICARAVAEARGFDRVVLVPTGEPPHKAADPAIASAAHRLAMCRLAVEASDLFDVDPIELDRKGQSYTIDTARELRRRGAVDVHWLIGADMLNYLPHWHEPAALLREVKFVIVARPGWTFDWDKLPPAFRELERQVVQTPLVEIGATQIRQRVRERKSIAYLTPENVVNYIGREGLYLK